ncbi:MAG: hypothetical protein ACOC6F_00890 [bacterium]
MWRRVGTIAALGVGVLVFTVLVIMLVRTPLVERDTLVVLIAALASVFGAAGALAAWSTVFEMRRDREELFRPDIFAGFEVLGSGLFYFVVKNNGRSPARHVKIDVDPSLVGMDRKPIDDVSWLRREDIRTLFPGQGFQKLVDVHHAVFSDDRPQEFSIRLSYETSAGKKYTDGP